MALKGLKVLEFVGLAPAPFCGKILVDFGATVTRIDKTPENAFDVLQHGKRTLAVNLKNAKGKKLVRRLVQHYDVLIEPFRPGVMEKLGLGPNELTAVNPRLVYARLTGFGQLGRLAARAGHDINYAAISGVLSMLGRHKARPEPPINLLADFAGGGLMCALGICMALLERERSGRGQVVDAAMIDGAAYVASWLFMSQHLPIWGNKRGCNTLDGGAYYYDTYETKDGLYMSVGALEPQFFELFIQHLELPELQQYVSAEENERCRAQVQERFLQKTQKEWSTIFENIDACVYPVLNWQEAQQHEHNRQRMNFDNIDGVVVPRPAPLLSRTPAKVPLKSKQQPSVGEQLEEVLEILKPLQLQKNELEQLIEEGVVMLSRAKL